MKKYLIKDEDNMSYEITEVEEQDEETPAEEEKPLQDDELSNLSAEELDVLRKLIPYADKLIALVAEEQPAEEDGIEDEDEDIEEDFDEEETEEEIVDTEAKDSINKAATSNKKQKVNDSIDDLEDDVSNVWSGRFQQFKKGESDY